MRMDRIRLSPLVRGLLVGIGTAFFASGLSSALMHGRPWLPWGMGLGLWLAGALAITLHYRRLRSLAPDPEETDERLRQVCTAAGQTAFNVQTMLLLVAVLWVAGAEIGLPVPAMPMGSTAFLLTLIVSGSGAVYLAAYTWRRYRV